MEYFARVVQKNANFLQKRLAFSKFWVYNKYTIDEKQEEWEFSHSLLVSKK